MAGRALLCPGVLQGEGRKTEVQVLCYRQRADLRSPKSKENSLLVPAATIWCSFAFIPQISEQAGFSLRLPWGGGRACMDSKDQGDGGGVALLSTGSQLVPAPLL